MHRQTCLDLSKWFIKLDSYFSENTLLVHYTDRLLGAVWGSSRIKTLQRITIFKCFSKVLFVVTIWLIQSSLVNRAAVAIFRTSAGMFPFWGWQMYCPPSSLIFLVAWPSRGLSSLISLCVCPTNILVYFHFCTDEKFCLPKERTQIEGQYSCLL